MNDIIENKLIFIEKSKYIYRVTHRIMEGDCKCEHGPLLTEPGGFYAQVYPVTNHMFKLFLDESGYKPGDTRGFLRHFVNGTYKEGEENLPVVNVNHSDAESYAAFYKMRLPTDLEWQYMAAGKLDLRYPWGNDYRKDLCNCDGNALTPVDAYPDGRSPFGLYDMCANAWEMTSEVHDDGCHKFILLRGGCFFKGPNYWHSQSGAMKNQSHLKMHLLGGAMDRNATVGFRCIKEAFV